MCALTEEWQGGWARCRRKKGLEESTGKRRWDSGGTKTIKARGPEDNRENSKGVKLRA